MIGAGCRIQNSTILGQTEVQSYSFIEGSIIGWKNTIGKWTRINGLTVTGEDVQVKDEIQLNGIMVLPHKGVAAN